MRKFFFAVTMAASLTALIGTLARPAAAQVVYSNVTSFTGSGFANGLATLNGANVQTALVADDINVGTSNGGGLVSSFTFSVGNFNTTAVSFRPLVRFFAANGTGTGPGTLLNGYNFNAVTLNANSVSTLTFTPAGGAFVIPSNGIFWAAITFDNNSGATGASLAQMQNIGQGLFNPPTIGSSQDAFFQSTASGAFTASNPSGGFFNFGGSPVGNFGWTVSIAAPEPGTIALFLVGGVGLVASVARRRKHGL
jgi:hypothetical protein